MGTNDSRWGVYMPACLVTCVRCVGCTDAWSELELAPGPVVCVAVEEVIWLSRKPCAFARGEQTYCSGKATWGKDMLRHRNLVGCATVLCGCGEIRACVRVKG